MEAWRLQFDTYSSISTYPIRICVWYIYLHLAEMCGKLGKYSMPYMDPMVHFIYMASNI